MWISCRVSDRAPRLQVSVIVEILPRTLSCLWFVARICEASGEIYSSWLAPRNFIVLMTVQQADVSSIVLECVPIGGSDQLFVVCIFSVLLNGFLAQVNAILLSALDWVGQVCLRRFLVGSALPKIFLTIQDF